MTKEEAKRFGLQLLHGIMERNESYPIYANNVKQAIDALSEPSGSSEIPKDLEEAAEESWQNSPDKGIYDEYSPFYKDGFIAGAKWQKEQIMKNAKDGWIDEECVIVLNDGTCIDLQPDYDKKPAFEFEYAQNVQVIVLPKEN